MQQSHRIKIFTRFTQSVKQFLTKQIMQALNHQYYIRQFKIWEIDASIATNLYFGIITRNKKTMGDKMELGWVQNELRLFVWTLVLYAYSNNVDIQELTQDNSSFDWKTFMQIFPNKPINLFIYQGKNLLKKHNQYKKWVHEEDTLFQQLVKKDNYRLKWSDLGKYLFIQSNRKYFRTPKQCRQRWLNHLDPSKLKKYWLEQEDFILIQYVKLYGKKWAAISKKLENKRNQHSIKNRFKSLLTKQSKLVMKPYNEQELVSSIYSKFMQKNKKQFNQNESNPSSQNKRIANMDQEIEQSQSSYESVSIFQEKENQAQPKILNTISLNTVKNSSSESSQDKNGINWLNVQKQSFQFSKNNYIEPVEQQKQWKKQLNHESEAQKRIRADLFLQQDPFELLKQYFYKKSH